MKHKFHRWLCVLLVLTMVVGLLPTGLVASAAVVELGASQYLVDDDFADAANKETVTATVGGVTYQGVIGTNAFATVTEALAKGANIEIYVAAGVYSEDFSISSNVSLYGNGMNTNPNNADWSANPARANKENETVFDTSLITVSGKTLTKLVINGFTFTGKSSVKEATSGGAVKGIDISYNCFYDNEQISAAQGCLYFTGTTTRSGILAYNRIENSVAAAKPLTFRNANNFTFKGNYVNVTASVGFWLSGEIADQNTTPGQMKMQVEENHIIASGIPIQPIVQYCNLYEATFRNNYLKGTTPLDFNAKETSTPNKVIVIEGNTLVGSTRDIAFWGATPYDTGVVSIKNNTFECGVVHMEWLPVSGTLDLSYNTFTGAPAVSSNPQAIMYPRYTSSGTVTGEMKLDDVILTGVESDGDKTIIPGVIVDNDAKTVTLKNVLDSIYSTIEVSAVPAASDATVNVEYYSDPACTNKLTGGNVVDYLKKGNNLVFIKLITSLDNYSYKIYTLTIQRESSHEALVTGIKNYVGTVDSNNQVQITIPTAETNPNIQLETSVGSTYEIFTDAAMTKPLGGTVIKELKAGSNTYYVRVTAEDGVTTSDYTLVLVRAPYSDTGIIAFNSPEFVVYDENEAAYLAVYSSKYDTIDVDVEIGDRATWELYSDAGCKKSVDPKGIELKTGDNTYFIKVIAEEASATEVHKVIFRKETAEASKQIYAVTSPAVSSAVTRDTVSVLLDCDTTTYTIALNFDGDYFKLYSNYEDGVLSGEVPQNLLNNIAGGKHTYYINVVAADGSSKVYTLDLEREFSDECLLTAIGGGSAYYVDRFDLTATTEVLSEGYFTPVFTVSDKATVVVLDDIGAEVTMPINLRAGVNEFVIVVTAENGKDKTEYAWTITCVGDGVEALSEGVVYNPDWSEYKNGDVIYASLNGVVYKVYFGDNAFATFSAARTNASAKGGIIYVMPGATVEGSFSLSGIKLYGANFGVEPNKSNRYPESYITGKVTLTGDLPEVKGFTLTETAQITRTTAGSVVVANNIFADSAERTTVAINFDRNVAYANLTISNNRFELDSDSEAIYINKLSGDALIENNVFKNTGDGVMLSVNLMDAGCEVEFASNSILSEGSVALNLESNVNRSGYLYVYDNVFKGYRAVVMNAAKAKDDFVFNFYNNKVETSSLSVVIDDAPATFATNFTANENNFDSIDHSFSFEYASSVAIDGLEPADLTNNYYGTSTPGNDVFDSTVAYKPYYQDADKSVLSNVVRAVDITAGGRKIVEDGMSNFAVIPGDSVVMKVTFIEDKSIPDGAYGIAYVAENKSFATNEITVAVTEPTPVYVQVLSADETVSETKTVMIYPQTANPVYAVYDVLNYAIEDMNVNVVVDAKAKTWVPAMAVVDDLDITLYSNKACTKKISGNVTLSGDSTVVYGKVDGHEPVTITIFKKLSAEKAILSIKDAYTFEYTGSDTAALTIDNRLSVADLTAEVSAGAKYTVYSDSALSNIVDESAVNNGTSKLYYKVVAADDTVKVFGISISWIDVVDPEILAVEDTTTVTSKSNYFEAQVKNYDANEGFVTKLDVPAGCTYKLYIDDEFETLYKNNTVYFTSNYVYVYAKVTSPDKVVTAEYTIKLTKKAATVKFVDAVPAWAKKAVNFTKDLGIVNGEQVKGGYKLNAAGTTTREMMACFIVRMLGVDATQYSYVDLTTSFVDADQVSSWAVGSMKAAVALGIFTGSKSDEGYYLNPKSDITRQEFAIVFVRAIDAEDVNVKSYSFKYSDAASIATWARTSVKIISKLGLMNGSDGKFMPKASITRVEIIQTIYNYMK